MIVCKHIAFVNVLRNEAAYYSICPLFVLNYIQLFKPQKEIAVFLYARRGNPFGRLVWNACYEHEQRTVEIRSGLEMPEQALI